MYAGKYKPVPIPKTDKGVIRIYSTGYVYYNSETHFDRSLGRSVDNRTSIGKTIPDQPGFMYPNAKYFEFFDDADPVPDPIEAKQQKVSHQISYGVYHAMYRTAEKTGCLSALKKAFPDFWLDILAMAIYGIVEQGFTGQTFEFWFYHNYCGLSKPLYSSEVSRLEKAIIEDEEAIPKFLQLFRQEYDRAFPSAKTRVVGFDSTNQNTSSEGITAAERGHAKKQKNLPIVNTAMFVDEITGIPIYYERFYGSLTDKTETPFTMDRVEELGYKKLLVMMDRGYYSKKAVDSIKEAKAEFGVMVPENTKIVNMMIEKYGPVIKNQNEYWIPEEKVYGIHIKDQDVPNLKDKYDVYVFYDDQRAADERSSIQAKIAGMKLAIGEKKRLTPTLDKKYGKWFKFETTAKDPETGRTFKFEVKDTEVQKEIDKAGLFVVVSNAGLSAAEMITIARHRDRSEKVFEVLKTGLGMETTYKHSDDTFDGLLFICFVALIIRQSFFWYEKGYINAVSSRTLGTVIGELSKYEIRWEPKQEKWVAAQAATQSQKQILKRVNVKESDLQRKIDRITLRV